MSWFFIVLLSYLLIGACGLFLVGLCDPVVKPQLVTAAFTVLAWPLLLAVIVWTLAVFLLDAVQRKHSDRPGRVHPRPRDDAPRSSF